MPTFSIIELWIDICQKNKGKSMMFVVINKRLLKPGRITAGQHKPLWISVKASHVSYHTSRLRHSTFKKLLQRRVDTHSDVINTYSPEY